MTNNAIEKALVSFHKLIQPSPWNETTLNHTTYAIAVLFYDILYIEAKNIFSKN